MKQAEVKIFITGSTGFIGKHLLQEPDFSAYKIFALTRDPFLNQETDKGNVTYLTGSLSNISDYSHILKECNYLIHIAGEKKNTAEMELTNVKGVESLLKELVKYPKVKLIFLSSGGVYGIRKHTEHMITEESQCFPTNDYERTKLKAEEIITKYSLGKSFGYIILRPTNVFGEQDKGRKLLNLCRSLQKNTFVLLSKTANVNYVYVKHVTAVIAEIIKKEIFTNEIYTINSPCNIYELVQVMRNALKLNGKPIIIPPVFRPVFYIAAKIFDCLPLKFQYFNSEKYLELTNKKIYLTKKINTIISIDEKEFLFQGIKNLVSHYQKESLI